MQPCSYSIITERNQQIPEHIREVSLCYNSPKTPSWFWDTFLGTNLLNKYLVFDTKGNIYDRSWSQERKLIIDGIWIWKPGWKKMENRRVLSKAEGKCRIDLISRLVPAGIVYSLFLRLTWNLLIWNSTGIVQIPPPSWNLLRIALQKDCLLCCSLQLCNPPPPVFHIPMWLLILIS